MQWRTFLVGAALFVREKFCYGPVSGRDRQWAARELVLEFVRVRITL